VIAYDDPRRTACLDALAVGDRGTWANIALGLIRGGVPRDRLRPALEGALLARLAQERRSRDVQRAQQAERFLALLAEHEEAVGAYLDWAWGWEHTPPAERARMKVARGEEHRRAWLAQQPPSEKQVAYCRSLGWTGAIESKAHASEIIDSCKRAGAA
jgi:hypothetical protein